MTDLERLLSHALNIRAEEAMMETDTVTTAQKLADRLDTEDRRRRLITWLATASVAAVAIVVAGFGISSWRASSQGSDPAGPAPSSSSSTATPLTAVFTSPLYGYSISLPATWHTSHVASSWWQWGTDNSQAGNAKVNDTYDGPDDMSINVAVQKVPIGTTLHSYIGDSAATLAPMPACFPGFGGWRPITVNGHPARFHGGISGCNFTEAAVLVDGRIYQITATPSRDATSYRVFDQGLFAQILRDIKLPTAPSQ